MKKNVTKIICWMWIVFFSSCAYAVNIYHYTCPELKVTQAATYEGADRSWEITPDKSIDSYALDRVGFLTGTTPFTIGEYTPDNSETIKTPTEQHSKAVWRFLENQGIWIACFYRNTQLIATRQLPSHITTCELVTQLLPTKSKMTGPDISGSQKITCK